MSQRIAKTLRLKGLPALGASARANLTPSITDETHFGPVRIVPDGPALGKKPRRISGAAWGRKDERQYEAILESCLAKKPRCTTKYTKGKRIRTCHRDCQRVAAATVNKHRKAEGRTGKTKKRSKR